MTCECGTFEFGGRTYVVDADPDCGTHGLPEGTRSVPHLRRHARGKEDDRQVELRLYHEAAGIAIGPFPLPLRRDVPFRFGQR